MVQYSPPPANLDRLNPIQRYMQKGSLDKKDYFYLILFVLAYVALRPAIKKGAAWLLGSKEFHEGQEAQKEHAQKRARAMIGANAIREGKVQPEILDTRGTDGVTATGMDSTSTAQLLNRKDKTQNLSKSEADKLLNWEDEPARAIPEGGKSDVATWLDHWDK